MKATIDVQDKMIYHPNAMGVFRKKSFVCTLAVALGGVFLTAQLAGCSNANSAPADAPSLSPQVEVKTGPADARFWDKLPPQVPANAQRGDILHVIERNDAPPGSKGYNVIYVSEGPDGNLAYVSGMIFYPTTGDNTSPRRVMLWNHETAGSGDACAPSRNGLRTVLFEIDRVHGLSEYLAKGYVVVASDYQGLGTPGPTVYMQGKPQAKASLDIVLAAQRLPSTNAGNRVAMAGFSQGGQTSLWASHLAPTYAPNLDIVGAALLAPAARTLELVQYEASNTLYGAYYMAIHAGMQAGHPELNLKDVITADGLELLPHLAYDCWSLWQTVPQKRPTVAKLDGLAPGTAWRAAHEANQAFLPIPAKTPLLIYQGISDVDVPLEMTRKLAKDLCTSGSKVDNREIAGGHGDAFGLTISNVVKWVDDRFAGVPAASTCSS